MQRRVAPRAAVVLVALGLAAPHPALAQGLAAGERARGEGRCPVGTVGEAMPGGYRCVAPGPAPPASQPAGAAGGAAREVSRGGLATAWPFALGAAAVLGLGIAAAGQGGSSPSGTR
jgi:hypothetical protein